MLVEPRFEVGDRVKAYWPFTVDRPREKFPNWIDAVVVHVMLPDRRRQTVMCAVRWVGFQPRIPDGYTSPINTLPERWLHHVGETVIQTLETSV